MCFDLFVTNADSHISPQAERSNEQRFIVKSEKPYENRKLYVSKHQSFPFFRIQIIMKFVYKKKK